MNYDIHVQLRSPELASAIRMLAEAIAGKPMPPLDKPVESPYHPVEENSDTDVAKNEHIVDQSQTTDAEITFEQVHKTLLDLKARKNAAAVREVLSAVDCKTVQDIPKDKFAEVLRLAEA